MFRNNANARAGNALATELALKAHCAFNSEQAHAPSYFRALRSKRESRSSRA
ncbi:hypothetical protein HMPREF1584_01144 [Gardnerella vaginalis JCP8481A]|nr:hypothetical protein HMPREF1584_01144 [Gardnerella vaginalis JCP8481A]